MSFIWIDCEIVRSGKCREKEREWARGRERAHYNFKNINKKLTFFLDNSHAIAIDISVGRCELKRKNENNSRKHKTEWSDRKSVGWLDAVLSSHVHVPLRVTTFCVCVCVLFRSHATYFSFCNSVVTFFRSASLVFAHFVVVPCVCSRAQSDGTKRWATQSHKALDNIIFNI